MQTVASVSDENDELERITNNGKMMIIATKSTNTKIKMKRIKKEKTATDKKHNRSEDLKRSTTFRTDANQFVGIILC